MKSNVQLNWTTLMMHGVNIIIHGIIVTFALLALLAESTDHFMGDFFVDLFSLIFLFTSGITLLGCLFFLSLLLLLRKKEKRTSYRIVTALQIIFALWLFVYGFILFAAVSKSGIIVYILISGFTAFSGLKLIVTSIRTLRNRAHDSV